MYSVSVHFKGSLLREYPLSEGRTTIGRRSDNDIQLDDPTVSGTHAILVAKPDPYYEEQLHLTVVDFNSTNGVQVNGLKVHSQSLQDGDRIAIGEHELLFNSPEVGTFEKTSVQIREGGA